MRGRWGDGERGGMRRQKPKKVSNRQVILYSTFQEEKTNHR